MLNLLFNVLYPYLAFSLKNQRLAAVDIVLLWSTLVAILSMTLTSPVPAIRYIGFGQVPYTAWVSYAMLLQFYVAFHN
jgi:tryptophan-rich sensory protein